METDHFHEPGSLNVEMEFVNFCLYSSELSSTSILTTEEPSHSERTTWWPYEIAHNPGM